jgi:hypothetical protein
MNDEGYEEQVFKDKMQDWDQDKAYREKIQMKEGCSPYILV